MRLRLGEQTYDLTHRALVMGVLPRTSDSLADGGRHHPLGGLLWRAEQLVADGADILDIVVQAGGEGSHEVSLAEETDLVCEAVIALLARFDTPISVDSGHARVAAAAFAAGAVLGNNTSGFHDPGYLPAAARAGAAVVARHPGSLAGGSDEELEHMGQGMSSALRHRVDVVVQAGIDPESVLLDPGLDQGMTGQQSVRLLGALPRLTTLGHPVLVATSYEGAFGGLVARAPDERREASVVACAIAATLGARVFRVHDVRSVRGAVDLACAVTGPSVG